MNLFFQELKNYLLSVFVVFIICYPIEGYSQGSNLVIEATLHNNLDNKSLQPVKGPHEVASIKGKGAWKINKEENKSLAHLYFDVNEKQFNLKGQTLTITLEYLSKGPGFVQFKYDSYDQKVKVNNQAKGAWKLGKQFNFQKNNKWITTTFTINDARFNKKCDNHDIVILIGSDEEVYVRSLKISRDPNSAPKVIKSISATLGSNPTFNKVIAVRGNGETATQPINIDGIDAWEVKSKGNKNVKMIYFDVNAKEFIAESDKLYAYLEYLDKGNGNIIITYDSKDVGVQVNPKAKPGSWKKAHACKLTNSGKWKKAYFEIDDARFQKNCNGHDIRINFNTGEQAIVKKLKFAKSKEELNKENETGAGAGASNSISASLGKSPSFNSLVAIKANSETANKPIELDGKASWEVQAVKNEGVKMIYFDVKSKEYINSDDQIFGYIEYLDKGNGSVTIFYDSKDESFQKNPKAKPGAWKKAHAFKLTNSGKWKKAYFEIADARFQKNCNGHDLRINFNTGENPIISKLKFAKSKEDLNKEKETSAETIASNTISASLGKSPSFNSLVAIKANSETANKPIDLDGRTAWEVQAVKNEDVKMIYFDVKSKEYINSNDQIFGYIEYLDKGNGNVTVFYDSKDESFQKNPKAKPGAWKKAHSFKLTNSGKWKKSYFTISDARFQKNCNGHDLRINFNTGENPIISKLKFAKSKAALNQGDAVTNSIVIASRLEKKPTFVGIVAIKGGTETLNETVTIDGVEAWDIKSKANNNVKMLYFDILSKEIVSESPKIFGYLEYLDKGTGNAAIFYDSKDKNFKKNPKTTPGAWKTAHAFKLKDSGKWKKAYFEIADARFEKNCNGHDIRVNINSNDKAIIRELKLANTKEGLEKEVKRAAVYVKKNVKMNTKHSKTFKFSTADMKVYTGYQGWFNAPKDGSGLHWKHYQKNFIKKQPLSVDNIRVDAWPDLSEFPESAKYDTPFKHKDGSTAQLFSSVNPVTQDIHFRWMKEYNIDAAFVQRFVTSAASPLINPNLNKVLVNSLEAAKKHNRGVAIMYDLSGMKGDKGVEDFIKDWKELVDKIKLTTKYKDVYLSTNGKPLVAIWGVGFDPKKKTRKYYLEHCEKIIDFLQNDPDYGGCSILLGVPTRWRDGVFDATNDPLFHDLVRRSDIVLPWYTGRIKEGKYPDFYPIIEDDIVWCKEEKLDFMPVLFPGFSWYNMHRDSKLNQIPRLKGEFFWEQMHGAAKAGAKMVYIGMFDEIDEATCFFKITNDIPVGLQMVDNEGLPTDHYLWLVKEGRKMLDNPSNLRKEIPTRKMEK
ncbi:glycoside hydrolase family 71/99-like protein [Flammeovirga agarivorans]|uniref:Carbohydrate-binding domain-containing protein n=1 Tax=Flammeovirga agarivorans TaxID=2726742 RepID=A0A7X8SNJ5_9BACT|nr:glycoside hydrolase family 71/99-like protein [Flammeovirga agarivorans]NLR93508.1 hypothetical protein [Flammeovirga agarivorans]